MPSSWPSVRGMRVLQVDDDRELAEYVRKGLGEENDAVTVGFDNR